MSTDMLMGLLRQVVPMLGMLAVAFGWIKPEAVEPWTASVLAIAGPGILFVGAIMAAIANSKKSIIASASQMSEVDSKKFAAAIADPTLKEVAQKNTTTAKD